MLATNKNKTAAVLAAMLSTTMLFTACSTKSTGSEATPAPKATDAPKQEQLQPVELVWYYPQPAVPADLASVEEAVNKITKEKINATVKLKPQAFGDYTQKMNTVVASGEAADLIWTSNWNFDYVGNQTKGAFIPLDDLLNKYAPDVKKSMPEFVINATKIGGKIYGIPSYQTVTNKEGFIVAKEFADKYKLDANSIKKLEDIEPFLKQIKDNEKGIIPFVVSRGGKLGNAMRQFNLEGINGIAAVDLSNPDKVINLYESDNYKKYLTLIRSWYTKGYINDDAATVKNENDVYKTGKVAVAFHNVLKPGVEAERKVSSGGKDQITIPLTKPFVSTGTIITTMNAISKTSKNPERAMMLINLVNTNKDLFNLLSFGVKDKHYTLNGNAVKVKDDATYKGADWVFGNVFNGTPLDGKDPAIPDQTKKENESATPSPLNGFKFIPGPVSAELANVATVIDQYGPGLNTGTIDQKEKLAEFIEKLKAAGADKIVAETQKQLDEWKKTK